MNGTIEANRSRNWIDVVAALSKIIASVAIPILLVVYGNSINSTIKEKEIGLKYVEVAVGILKSKPSAETTALRKWAISIIQKHSTIPLNSEAIKELESAPLPKADYLIDENGNFITDEKGNKIILK